MQNSQPDVSKLNLAGHERGCYTTTKGACDAMLAQCLKITKHSPILTSKYSIKRIKNDQRDDSGVRVLVVQAGKSDFSVWIPW